MPNYLEAENLKCKGTFAKRLVVITPVLMLFLALISGRYFVENGYNCWSSRLMFPVLGVLPQGVMANPGDPMLNDGVIPVGVVLSIVLLALLLFATAQWFPKQEVK